MDKEQQTTASSRHEAYAANSKHMEATAKASYPGRPEARLKVVEAWDRLVLWRRGNCGACCCTFSSIPIRLTREPRFRAGTT